VREEEISKIKLKKAFNCIKKDIEKENITLVSYNKDKKKFLFRWEINYWDHRYKLEDVFKELEDLRKENFLNDNQLQKLEEAFNINDGAKNKEEIKFPYQFFKEIFNFKKGNGIKIKKSDEIKRIEKEFNIKANWSYFYSEVSELKSLVRKIKEKREGVNKGSRKSMKLIKYYLTYYIFDKETPKEEHIKYGRKQFWKFIMENRSEAKKENMLDFLNDLFPNIFNYYVKSYFVAYYVKNCGPLDLLDSLLNKEYINVDDVIYCARQSARNKQFNPFVWVYHEGGLSCSFKERKKIIEILIKHNTIISTKIIKNVFLDYQGADFIKRISFEEDRYLVNTVWKYIWNKNIYKDVHAKNEFYKVFNKLYFRDFDYKTIHDYINKIKNFDKVKMEKIAQIFSSTKLSNKERIKIFKLLEKKWYNLKKEDFLKRLISLSRNFSEIDFIIEEKVSKKENPKEYLNKFYEFVFYIIRNVPKSVLENEVYFYWGKPFLESIILSEVFIGIEIKKKKNGFDVDTHRKNKSKIPALQKCIKILLKEKKVKVNLVGIMELMLEAKYYDIIRILIEDYWYSTNIKDYNLNVNKNSMNKIKNIFDEYKSEEEIKEEEKEKKNKYSISKFKEKYPPEKYIQENNNKDNYIKFEEYNDHEGERWYFYININENLEYIKLLSSFLNYIKKEEEQEIYYQLKGAINKNKINVLIEEDDAASYMNKHNIINKAIPIKKLKKAIKQDLKEWWYDNVDRLLYKGGLLN